MQNWFRTLIPSWRLFENTGEIALLYFRSGENENSLSLWQERKSKLKKKNVFIRLFFNPTATIEHANQNLLYHFLYEIEKSQKDFEQLKTYQLIQNLIEEENPKPWYQFQIRSFNQKNNQQEILVTSALHQASSK